METYEGVRSICLNTFGEFTIRCVEIAGVTVTFGGARVLPVIPTVEHTMLLLSDQYANRGSGRTLIEANLFNCEVTCGNGYCRLVRRDGEEIEKVSVIAE